MYKSIHICTRFIINYIIYINAALLHRNTNFVLFVFPDLL